ncbi:MAG: HD domain-containing protein [Atopobiaceae bacterium]|jgi:dGTPase|nr:HD domain-containing protein [Atopobiaceae bacterium]
MSESTVAGAQNPLAPNLAHELSDEVAQAVRDLRSAGGRSPYAARGADAVRREDAPRDRETPARPAYVRDAEKIMHLPSYNRLAGKTQVFSFAANDDITRRGLHVQLVARVALDIGSALGLDLDLVNAIALGHDIGHTPFGHAGERFLNDSYHARTGRWFFHNVQSVRVLDVLYGRNLSLQTLDGVICHNGEFEQQVLRTSELSGFDGPDGFDATVEGCWASGKAAIGHLRPMTLEGCVVRLADIIAYVGKDRQDAIRAKLVEPGAFADGLGGAYNAWALSAFVTDVIEHSFGRSRIQMSEEAFHELARAKRENYELVYGASEITGERAAAIGELFEMLYERLRADLEAGDERSPIFKHHIAELASYLGPYGHGYDWQSDLDLAVVDYLSSMTDDYFMALCERLFPEARELFRTRGYFDRLDPGWA